MKAYGLTDIGRIRRMNQDAFFISSAPVGPLPNLFFVADGMGGHKAGDYASTYLVSHLVEYIRESEETDIVSVLKEAIVQVNGEIFRLSRNVESLSGMGTTLVCAVVDNGTLCAANVGDSRMYLIDHRGISQITKDHSFVEEMVDCGQMTRGSEEYERRKNIITRAIGVGPLVKTDFFKVPFGSGDYCLLCSDGLSNMITNRDMLKIIRSDMTVEEKTRKMVAMANENGGRDNISVVLVEAGMNGGDRS